MQLDHPAFRQLALAGTLVRHRSNNRSPRRCAEPWRRTRWQREHRRRDGGCAAGRDFHDSTPATPATPATTSSAARLYLSNRAGAAGHAGIRRNVYVEDDHAARVCMDGCQQCALDRSVGGCCWDRQRSSAVADSSKQWDGSDGHGERRRRDLDRRPGGGSFDPGVHLQPRSGKSKRGCTSRRG